MTFIIKKDIVTRAGAEVVWVEAGEYPFIRFLDDRRVLIDIGKMGDQLLTIVRLTAGKLSNA